MPTAMMRKDDANAMPSPAETSRIPPEFSGRLTLRGMRVFVALEETRSVAEAAKFLGISKSNVSQQITSLEASVGTRLFDRQQKPISLTPAGQVLSLHAHRILAMVSVAEASLAELNLDGLPQLNFAIIDDLDASLTPVLAASLQSQMPKCFIRTFSGRSDQVTARLTARQADIAVTATIPIDMHKFQVLPLMREKFVLVTAKGKYQRDSDWRSALAELPLIQYSEAMPMGQLVATHLKRIGFHTPRRFSFETSRSVIATVAKTGGWTLSTPLSILDALRFRDQIDISPLPFAGVSRQIYLISRMEELGSLPALLATQFRRLLQDEVVPEFEKAAPRVFDALEVHNDAMI
jgi:DNA-binding transcriptional LysR family regulator